MKKTIAIYFSDPEPMGYPFKKQPYLEKYIEVIKDIEKRNINVVIVRADSYIKDGRFTKGWKLVDGQATEVEGEIKADLIFNRDDKNTIPFINDCKIINHPDFDRLCVDKVKTFETYPEISPKTASINSYQSCLDKVKEWQINPEELIVLKQNFATEGRGIYVIPASDIKESLYTDWKDIMIQEFLDSSIGVPGLTDGLHDLRITVINGVPINSYMRVPKKGSYLANVAQGATGTSINLEDVPKEVIELVHKVEEKVKKYFPSIYAADFIHSQKGYKLLELNSRPTIQHPDWSKTYKKFNDAMIEMLVNAVNE